MEMCVDNPREGFGELFDTHPTVENRVEALVKYAGGHDPGPIALPAPGIETEDDSGPDQPPQSGPWTSADSAENDAAAPSGRPAAPDQPPGPWGRHSA
jgi:heat shock protein HtpX